MSAYNLTQRGALGAAIDGFNMNHANYHNDGSAIFNGTTFIGAVPHDRSDEAISAAVAEAAFITTACKHHQPLMDALREAVAELQARGAAPSMIERLIAVADSATPPTPDY